MRLTPFNLTQNISVDNALSTIQVIHQIITKVNNVVDYVNNLENNSNKYTDEQIKNVLEQLETNLTTLENALKLYVDNKVDNLKSYVDNENNDIKSLIDNKVEKIYADMNDLENSLRLYIDTGDTNIKVYINDIYKELYDLIMNGNDTIYSPVDGFLKSTKDALQDLTHVIQIKNGIDWDTFESLCSGDSVDLTGYTKPNDNYDIWLKYDKPSYAETDYLNENGLHIVCTVAISSVLIDGQPFTFFNGAGVLLPLGNFDSNETIIVITDVIGNVTTLHVRNTDYSNASVTWDSMEEKLNRTVNNRYFNWNSLSFYTVKFVNHNLMATDGKMKSVLPETMYTTEFNKKFFGGN